jgi:hypothetical protein
MSDLAGDEATAIFLASAREMVLELVKRLVEVESRTAKIQQHIGECKLRMSEKREMWRQAENAGDWINSESLGKSLSIERSFCDGLERALKHLADDQ